MLTTCTAPVVPVFTPFHRFVMVVPLGRFTVTRQPVIALAPAVTFTLATKPPSHDLLTLNAAEQVRPPDGDAEDDRLADGDEDTDGGEDTDGDADRLGLGDALRDGDGLAEAERDGDGLADAVGGVPLALVITTTDSAGTD